MGSATCDTAQCRYRKTGIHASVEYRHPRHITTKSAMIGCRSLVFAATTSLLAVANGASTTLQGAAAASSDAGVAKSFGDISINSGSAGSLLILLPIFVIIILLDLAIFGVFSQSVTDLNPISRFFYHVKDGTQILAERFRRRRRYRKRYRVQRSLLNNFAGPL